MTTRGSHELCHGLIMQIRIGFVSLKVALTQAGGFLSL